MKREQRDSDDVAFSYPADSGAVSDYGRCRVRHRGEPMLSAVSVLAANGRRRRLPRQRIGRSLKGRAMLLFDKGPVSGASSSSGASSFPRAIDGWKCADRSGVSAPSLFRSQGQRLAGAVSGHGAR
ncbi:hypothetical protein MRX96_038610 [Rhipicephalus microplus]